MYFHLELPLAVAERGGSWLGAWACCLRLSSFAWRCALMLLFRAPWLHSKGRCLVRRDSMAAHAMLFCLVLSSHVPS